MIWLPKEEQYKQPMSPFVFEIFPAGSAVDTSYSQSVTATTSFGGKIAKQALVNFFLGLF